MTDAQAAWALAIVGPLAVAGALAGIAYVVRHARRGVAKAGRAFDIILGTPERSDPLNPAEILVPAVPDIGTRMGRAETLLADVVVRTVEEAKRSAAASAASAEAAQAAAEAAREIAEHLEAQFTGLSERVEQWQGVDRVKADTLDAVVTELGIPGERPRPSTGEAS